MATLNSNQHSSLEKTIIKARRLAEAGAIKALQNLAVDSTEPFSHMDASQRKLRNQLRFKGRLIGDELINGKQNIDHLGYELAYEYWHRMLFASFLEANNLLIHPGHHIAVSFADCEEFAHEEGFSDKWIAAAHYASHMLPAIFRLEDPLMQVEFATEDRLALEQLLESIEEEIFIAGDSLGWVYQYWQSEEQNRINKSEVKIDGEKLPAVTQFFTEPYMVRFLIHNTIGAWWANQHPNQQAPVEFEYLRLLDDGISAAGKFEGWPDQAKNITTLDPCMGSGHFIVELFNVLVPIRMQEEGLSKEDASKRVIAENLHGLEIDARCTQIAAFNLALTAWKFNGKYIDLPKFNLACCGIAPKGKKSDWKKLVSNVKDIAQRARMERGMEVLYDHFQLAPELGSLLDPSTIKSDAFTAGFDELLPMLEKALEIEASDDAMERGIMAFGIAHAGQMLSKYYFLHITNVPYLSRGRQDNLIADFCNKNYPESKGDLATVFIDRLLKITHGSGTVSCVMPQNWLFMMTYKSFRINLLKTTCWNFILTLGPGAFSHITGEVVKAILSSFTKSKPNLSSKTFCLDLSYSSDILDKAISLKSLPLKFLSQNDQLKNPDSRFILEDRNSDSNIPLLQTYIDSFQGIKTGDDNRFKFLFWEVINILDWRLSYGSPLSNKYGGEYYILNWSNKGSDFARFQGQKAFSKRGFYLTNVGKLRSSSFNAHPFTSEITVIVPKQYSDALSILAYLESSNYETELRKIDQNLAISTSSVGKVPFKLDYWNSMAISKYPNGFPNLSSCGPTQWLFHGHPKPSESPLQISICRLMGYQWPAENDAEIELPDEAKQCIREIRAFNHLADEDGIVCIPSVNGEQPAAERLRDYIREVWQRDWDHNTIINLLKQADSNKTNLESWLREEFFEQHIKLFHNRPFIWHIWDGRKDGFSTLVNYHKLNKATLQKLIYTYLGDWIRQCELKVKDNESGADGLLMAAKKLKEQLLLILEGEPPYDIFVRWKPLEQQPIGWEPDINDGVRLNIYPFMKAGVLRKNPNIKWEKDRGKNPPGAPWGPDRFNRYEDFADEYKLKDEQKKVIPSLTNEVKRNAKEKNKK